MVKKEGLHKVQEYKRRPSFCFGFYIESKTTFSYTAMWGRIYTEGRVFAGVLGLHTVALINPWGEISDSLGLFIMETRKEVLLKNIMIKMELSATNLGTYKKC